MTIVRLNLTGVSPGTSCSIVRLHGTGSGSCRFHAHRPVRLGRGVPDSELAAVPPGTTAHPIDRSSEEVTT